MCASVAGALLLAGCSSESSSSDSPSSSASSEQAPPEDGERSSVTEDQLRAILLVKKDMGKGWTSEPNPLAASSVTGESLSALEDKACDVGSIVFGDLLVNDKALMSVYSTAEPVCGSIEFTIDSTKASKDLMISTFEDSTRRTLDAQGVTMENFSGELVDSSALGEDTIVYKFSADLTAPTGETGSFDSMVIIVAGNKAALSTVVESYTKPLKAKEIRRLVGVMRSNLESME